MPMNLDRYKKDLLALLNMGDQMSLDLALRALELRGNKLSEEQTAIKKSLSRCEDTYQQWYTESHALFRQVLPERLPEFEMLYCGDPKRKTKDINAGTFTIQDWLLGMRAREDSYRQKFFDDFAAFTNRIGMQLELLKSLQRRFESSLFDIRHLVRADLFDSELESGRELLKRGYGRAAGVMAGIVLEKHLTEVCATHQIAIKKKNPTLSDLNELLKNEAVIEIPTWRFIQRLGDLRNLCSHNKEREATEVEVTELLDGVEKLTKTLY